MGCDSTSSFYGKTKKTAWSTWSIYPEVSESFVFMVENTFTRTDYTAQFFHLLERFTVLLYDKTSCLESVNKACLDLFFARKIDLWNIYYQHK